MSCNTLVLSSNFHVELLSFAFAELSCVVVGCRNEPGFLKMFNGYWDVEPRMVNGKSMGCNVVVTQEVLPSMLPPGPLGTGLEMLSVGKQYTVCIILGFMIESDIFFLL